MIRALQSGRPPGLAWKFAVLTAWCLCANVAVASNGMTSADVGIVINTADPLSAQIGAYYAQRRHIPPANIARVQFEVSAALSPAEFRRIKAQVDAQLPASVQAYALTWAQPFRVGCMSVTAAFAFGYDEAYCAVGCKLTKPDSYFDSGSSKDLN